MVEVPRGGSRDVRITLTENPNGLVLVTIPSTSRLSVAPESFSIPDGQWNTGVLITILASDEDFTETLTATVRLSCHPVWNISHTSIEVTAL